MLPFAAIAASTAAGPTTQAPTAAVVAVTAPHLPAILSSAGVLILCCAAAALMLAGIPLLWSLARAANRMESMLQVGWSCAALHLPQTLPKESDATVMPVRRPAENSRRSGTVQARLI